MNIPVKLWKVSLYFKSFAIHLYLYYFNDLSIVLLCVNKTIIIEILFLL